MPRHRSYWRHVRPFALVMAFLALLVLIGTILHGLMATHGLERVRDVVSEFDHAMRIVRPTLLILIISFWPCLIRITQNLKLIDAHLAGLAVTHWLPLSLWIAVIEITVFQGWVLIGTALATGLFTASRWNLLPKGSRSDPEDRS